MHTPPPLPIHLLAQFFALLRRHPLSLPHQCLVNPTVR